MNSLKIQSLSFKSQFLLYLLFLWQGLDIQAQEYIFNGDFSNIEIKSKNKALENAYLDLSLSKDLYYLPFSSPSIKVKYKDSESQTVIIHTQKGDFLQTKLCCYPEKEKAYVLSLEARNSEMNEMQLQFLGVWILEEAYSDQDELPEPNMILDIKEKWKSYEEKLQLSGKERFILLSSLPEKWWPEGMKEYVGEGYFFGVELDKLSLQIPEDDLKDGKSRSKMEF